MNTHDNTSTHRDKCIGNVTHFIELKRLYQSMPKHLQKKVSCHDLKLICDAYNGDQPPIDNQFVADGCEKFAPAPEEAVPCKHSDDVNCRSCHVGEATGEVKEPAPEWRELGPDEAICEGDEEMHKDQNSWFPIEYNDNSIGTAARIWSNFRFRTRRPLCPNDAPKQEEMPLEDEIVRLQEVGRLNYAEGQQDLTDCLRYLRDEIEALKKNQK